MTDSGLRPGPAGPGCLGGQFLQPRVALAGGPWPAAGAEAAGRSARGGAAHLSLALAPVRAACPWMVRMSSTHGVYFWLFPLNVEPAIRPDTFCFFKYSLVCDSDVEMRSEGRARICIDTEVPIVSL